MIQLGSILVIFVFAVWLIGVSLFALFKPKTAIKGIGKMASTNFINYTELSLRALVGAAFICAADLSPRPQVFQIIGWFMLISAVILMLIPRQWHASYSVYWAQKMPVTMVYLSVPFAIMAGAYLICILTSGLSG